MSHQVTKEKLHQLCGIASIPPVPEKKWVSAIVKFIGAEGYVLKTKAAQVKLTSNKKGFCLLTNGTWSIRANALLGDKVRQGRLYDVEVVVEDIVTMHLANLCPGRYPIVLRKDEVVNLN